MAQRRLRELLTEDQEPFLLTTFIADVRKSQLTRPVRPRKLVRPTNRATFAGSFCRTACLFSVLPDSPDPSKSPLFDFAASPRKSPTRIFLHVPAKTAALLLEAAVRIQQKSACPAKPKPAKKGLFGSILKRLTQRNRAAPAREIQSERRRSFGGPANAAQLKSAAAGRGASPVGGRGHSRRSSGLWSESNGERSLDLETSTSGSDSIELVPEEEEHEEVYVAFDEAFCGSPFRFVLRRSTSSSGDRTPDFTSPATSPSRCNKKEIDRCDVETSTKLVQEEEDEEKEQCSPVSVLDAPFEDGHDLDEDEEEDGFDYECSYANVQRAKQKLLEKLHRFEKLASLDPVELEKRMSELDEDEEGYTSSAEANEDDEEPEPLDEEFRADRLITEVLKSKFDSVKKIPNDMKRLVTDLVAEERGRQSELQGGTLTRRVYERLDSWKRVDLNTIDMMVEKDFRRELGGWNWKHNQDQADEVATGIEFAICGLLVEELVDDLY